jgi:hypothetical protein
MIQMTKGKYHEEIRELFYRDMSACLRMQLFHAHPRRRT